MAIVFMDPNEPDEAASSWISEDESVLANVLAWEFGVDEDGNDIRLYSCLVYAGYEWRRVNDPEMRQFMYELRTVACRYSLPFAEARAYAQGLTEGPAGV